MNIISPSFEMLDDINGKDILRRIEVVGRTCYKSEDKITEESAVKFVAILIKHGHEAMIECVSISVRIICDRGVTHEIVRHRLASYAQESTRYCNYSGEKFGNQITVINPRGAFWGEDNDRDKLAIWLNAMHYAEGAYLLLLEAGATPQEARSVLPNSLKTEIVVTMNLREWRHFFKLRTADAAHPQMREIARPILKEFQDRIPVIYDDITY
jgi:thymidylate synthase (FAD)